MIGHEVDNEYTIYHFDYRGSTVVLTDSSKTPFLFNGMYGVMTDSNGLYYMRARFYNPEIKRFINQDILLGGIGEGQTLNRYAFVTGRPISLVDPFGLKGAEYNHRCKMGSCHDYDGTPGRPMTSTEELILDVLMCLIPTGEFTLILPAFKQAKIFSETSSLWESQSLGVQVRQFGDWWVKRTNPDANSLMQWWGNLTMEAQAKALKQLGDLGAEFQVRNGNLFVKNVGEISSIRDIEYWEALVKGSWRLKSLLHDIKPRNVGKNGVIFDPAIDPLSKAIGYAAGAGAYCVQTCGEE